MTLEQGAQWQKVQSLLSRFQDVARQETLVLDVQRLLSTVDDVGGERTLDIRLRLTRSAPLAFDAPPLPDIAEAR